MFLLSKVPWVIMFCVGCCMGLTFGNKQQFFCCCCCCSWSRLFCGINWLALVPLFSIGLLLLVLDVLAFVFRLFLDRLDEPTLLFRRIDEVDGDLLLEDFFFSIVDWLVVFCSWLCSWASCCCFRFNVLRVLIKICCCCCCCLIKYWWALMFSVVLLQSEQ